MYILVRLDFVLVCFIDLQERMERDGTPAVGILRQLCRILKDQLSQTFAHGAVNFGCAS